MLPDIRIPDHDFSVSWTLVVDAALCCFELLKLPAVWARRHLIARR